MDGPPEAPSCRGSAETIEQIQPQRAQRTRSTSVPWAQIKLSLRTLDLDCWDYAESDNPPILHRKETFLEPSHSLYARFARLTAQEEHHGLLDETATIGTRAGWQQRLDERGFTLTGHRLVRTRRDRYVECRLAAFVERRPKSFGLQLGERPADIGLLPSPVAPDRRFEKFAAEIARPTFFRALEKPLHTVCRFIPYGKLLAKLQSAEGFIQHLKPSFLDDVAAKPRRPFRGGRRRGAEQRLEF
jgi:hypothetical protein